MSRIIAEVGSNFRTLDHCIQSIGQAKALGADAVKFQMFSDADLYGYGSTEPRGIDPKWLPKLAEKAKACGIEFMCTAFSFGGAMSVDPFVSTHKVASSDACYFALLSGVALTKKPVYISTGGHGDGEIDLACRFLDDHGAGPITALYCVSEYPTRRVDPRALLRPGQWVPERADSWGFSDHTLDVLGMPVVAAIAGASVIEKHVTFFPEIDSPDRPHSLTPGEFDEMVRAIRGSGEEFVMAPRRNEDAMVMRHNRRMMVTKPIAKGEQLYCGVNVGAYRSRVDTIGALPPWAPVTGETAARDLVPGEPVTPEVLSV